MADTRPRGSSVGRVTRVLLALVLGCLGVLLYKAFEKRSTPTDQAAAGDATARVSQRRSNATALAAPPSGTNAQVPRLEASLPRPETSSSQAGATAPAIPAAAPEAPQAAPTAAAPAESTTGLAATGPVLRFAAQPTGSEMRIDGTATGKSWACIGKLIAGSFEVEPAWQSDPSLKSITSLGTGKTPPKCDVSIPIRSLKSQAPVGASIMDRRMQKEMKADQFQKIEYQLTEMVIKGEVPASGSPVTFDTKGRLAISGVTNAVSFPITMERKGPDALRFKGTYPTKMTAFGIKPPEFELLGITLRTGNDVTLTWTWTVALQTSPVSK